MNQDLLDIVTVVALTARKAWEPVWPIWKSLSGHPSPDGLPSVDACIPTSFALGDILNRVVSEYSWRAVGGRPTKRTPAGGFSASEGSAHGHFWVEGKRCGDLVVVDITADQFDGEPVIVHEGPSPRHSANATRNLIRAYRENEQETVSLFIEIFDAALGILDPEGEATT